MFQSTHPRGVRRPQDGVGPAAGALVSIHAPAWGATRRWRIDSGIFRVSIHAPAWGATLPCWSTFSAHAWFQSTHPRGVRRCSDKLPSSLAACFNPRTRVGCDASFLLQRNRRSRFQSTHPRGVRPILWQHHHESADVSIHAPAWGATWRCPAWGSWGASFNPRTRVGCDQQCGAGRGGGKRVSIHAPAWGATIPAPDHGWSGGCFNPRTRVGCDKSNFPSSLQLTVFQSTHPRGVRQREDERDA